MIEIGRLVLKIAGRDAGKKAVIVDIIDQNYVLLDGETRRRKCNVLHVEPLKEIIKIEKNAGHDEVKKEFEKLGLKAFDSKPKNKTQRPKKVKQKKENKKPAKEKKVSDKKETKK